MKEPDLISLLSTSFSRQLARYRELSDLVQKTLGKLVLTRGDVSQVMDNFKHKQEILEAIIEERGRVENDVATWQQNKNNFPDSPAVSGLNELLKETASTISEFLEGEAQLKRYLEHFKKPGNQS
jgi:hypothetical protein